MSKHLFVKCTNVHLCSLAMVMLLLFLPSMAIKAASQSLTVSGVVFGNRQDAFNWRECVGERNH